MSKIFGISDLPVSTIGKTIECGKASEIKTPFLSEISKPVQKHCDTYVKKPLQIKSLMKRFARAFWGKW